MKLSKLTHWFRQITSRSKRPSTRHSNRLSRQAESFESRCLLTVSMSFNYSLDTNGFFTSGRKAILEAAATELTQRLNDTLSAITPSANNTWTAEFSHPGTGASHSVSNMSVPANTLIVFAGARDLGSTLGIGGPGGAGVSFIDNSFRDAVLGRGEPGALTSGAKTDFGPWGGAITFNNNVSTNWHFGLTTTGLDSNESDFYSVALHELGHLIGIGTAQSWDDLVVSHRFTGAVSQAEYDQGGTVPLFAGDDSHWADGTNDGGRETAMDPIITQGTRKTFTELDFAALDDIGWEVGDPPLTVQRVFTLTNGATHTVVVSDSGTSNDGSSQITIDGVTTVFVNPSNALIIEGGNLADTITINSMDSGFIASITINGNDGNDSVTINTDIGAAKQIDLGNGTDSVSVSGATATSVALALNSAMAATQTITNAGGTETVVLSNVENLADTITSATRTFSLLATADVATLGDDGVTSGVSRLSGTSFSLAVNFTNPTTSLTLNAGAGNDTITVGPLDGSLASALTVNGEANSDNISAAGISLPITIDGGTHSNTLVGGSGNDTLTGNTFDDVMTGGAGADIINPGDGFDTLIESQDVDFVVTATTMTTTPPGGGTSTVDTISGFDRISITGGPSANTIDLRNFTPASSAVSTIIGGGGRDNVFGTIRADLIDLSTATGRCNVDSFNGNDTITTGSGDDRIFSGGNNDSVISGAGNDTVQGGTGNDTINGGTGNDILYGQNDPDSIIAGDGDDTVQGSTGNDTISGGIGADVISGGTENDFILGGSGADSLAGDPGDDTLRGEADNDQLRGSSGNDDIDGGTGTDRIAETADTNMTVVGFTLTSPFLGTETHVGIERYNLNGGAGSNVIDIRLADVFGIIHGFEGNDTILGSRFADQLFGEGDVDVISGGAGVDLIDGGDSSNDVFYEKADGNFTIVLQAGSVDANDFVVTSNVTGNETILNFEKFVIIGGASNNVIDCSAIGRNCTLLGGGGNDTLLGGVAKDTLIGGSRADSTGGIDSLNGGGASDIYDDDAADTRVVVGDTVTPAATVLAALPAWIDTI